MSAKTFNYPFNLTSATASTFPNIFIPSNATIGNVFYTTLTAGNLVTNNVNLGIASLYSGSFIASNNVVSPASVTGLLFNSANIRYIEIKVTVTVTLSSGGPLVQAYTLYGYYNTTWSLLSDSIGDTTTVVFSMDSSTGQIYYTSSNISLWTSTTIRYSVQQFSSTGTYTSILGNTVGSYLLQNLQINDTTDSIPGTSNGGLYLLGGATISKQINIQGTSQALGLGSGGSLTSLGGASISKTMYIGGGITSNSGTNTLGNIYTNTAGSIGIGNVAPNANYILDVNGNTNIAGGLTVGNVLISSGTISNLVGLNLNYTNISVGTISGSTLTIGNIVATTGFSTGTLSISGTSNSAAISTGNIWVSGNLSVAGTFTSVNVTSTNLVETNATINNLIVSGNISANTLQLTGNISAGSSVATIGTIKGSNLNYGNISVGGLISTSFANLSYNSNTLGNLFTTGGNVGINTISPGTICDVNGSFRVISNNSITTGRGIELVFSTSASTGNIYSFDRSNSLYNTLNLNDKMVIMSSGNVGINTTIPSYTLDVNGTSRMIGTVNLIAGEYIKGLSSNTSTRPSLSTTVGAYEIRGANVTTTQDDGFIRISAGGGTSIGVQSYIDLSGYSQVSDMNSSLIFGTNGTERLRIQNGLVGINTSNPSYTLDVNGTGRFTQSRISTLGYQYNSSSTNGNSFSTDLRSVTNRIKTSRSIANKCVSTWTQRTMGQTGNLDGICWSPELSLFAVVNATTTTTGIQTSPDGINWTVRTTPNLAYNGTVIWVAELGLFLAGTSTSTNNIVTSSDGITWTAQTTPSVNAVIIVWSPELYLLVASSGSTLMISTNGTNWGSIISNSGHNILSMCWSSDLNLFLGAEYGNSYGFSYSSNGTTWTGVSTGGGANWLGMCYSPELHMCLAVSQSGTTNNVATSVDGINWTIRTGVSGTPLLNFAIWAPEVSLFMVGQQGGGIYTSHDGLTWINRLSTASTNPPCWSPELSIFVVVVYGTNTAYTSNQGLPVTNRITNLINSYAYYLSLSGSPSIYNTSFVSQGGSTSTSNAYYYLSFPTTNNQNFSPIITSNCKYGVPVNGIYLFKFSAVTQNSSSQTFISKNSAGGNDLNIGTENLLALGTDGITLSAVISMTTTDFVTFGFFLGTGTATMSSRGTAQIFCLQRTS